MAAPERVMHNAATTSWGAVALLRIVIIAAVALAWEMLAASGLLFRDVVPSLGGVVSAVLSVRAVQVVIRAGGVQPLRATNGMGGPMSDLTSGLVLVTLPDLLFKQPFAAYHWAFRHQLHQSSLVQTVMVAARSVAAAAA